MNEHDDIHELPELRDRDVELLYEICKRASDSDDAPFKALFAAYDAILVEQGEDTAHDDVVFRYLMRIGETTRTANRERRPVDLVKQLRDVLDALGITVLDPQEGEGDSVTGTVEVERQSPRRPYTRRNRRVSFEDARFEETWLSEHTEPVNPPTSPLSAPHGLLNLPPRRGRNLVSPRRARSISSHRSGLTRNSTTRHSQHPSPSTADVSEVHERDHLNPTLYFEPSQTQLEQNAEAFLSTSALRSARHALHSWHDLALGKQQRRQHAHEVATAHDRRTLLKQSLDQWRATLDSKRQVQRHHRHLEKLEERARRARNSFLIHKSFTHWATSCEHEKLKTTVAQRHILKVSYFRRWKAIASENQAKIRKILVRKYLAVWREKTARRLLWEEQAVAHYKETLTRKCKSRWFWLFCSRRVEGWHERWMEKRALGQLLTVCQTRWEQQQQAEEFHHSHALRQCLRAFTERLRTHRSASATAEQRYDRTIAGRSLNSIQALTKLAPIVQTMTLKADLDLLRKAFRIWHLHLNLSRQAAEVDRKRILQTAWTHWNDALRCKALAQKIDERLLIENMYRWLLQERLRLFQRTVDVRTLGRALGWWRAKVEAERDQIADAEFVFAERQRRRRLAYGMFRLNITMRAREDAERAGLELTNSRLLPKALELWKDKTDHARGLAKWAAKARFWCLCMGTLKIWKERTSEHKANRRRDAYVQVRANLKIKLVGRCFGKLRTVCMELHSMNGEAERRAQARVTEVASRTLAHWRGRSEMYAELNAQAVHVDQQKLLSSALIAVVVKRNDIDDMEQAALDLKRRFELELLAGALRRVQWATFTAARKAESADALWRRNRDQHKKQMLRYWAAKTAVRRAPAVQEEAHDDEPESPSLRPASRAASRLEGRPDFTLPSSPPTQGPMQSTPGYMRTPSRTRRSGRFRPLPTPVPFTPLAFDSAYLATTPAPLPTDDDIGGPRCYATEGLTPQVTPFSRKLRAGGFPGTASAAPPSALRSSVFGGRPVQGGTNKSVRFAGPSRFRAIDDEHVKTS
ncbi:hypothetical protein LTR37_012626 [Vermiconidia calcicola]|uniref:Uncharacterized protein n=1 Tax=Vermiconidia calcicola TaxID=1690605 RepID=A0ACC3MYP1_9PEZI|nr:hypothetical protein LTR37_012626 [Vermiconidia calcicola]